MKRDDKLFSIGEIAKALGVTRRIILHYEERGLIEPDKRDDATNNRYYTIDTFTKLRSIRSLQNLGLTLDEIRDYYNDSTDLMPLIRRMEEMRDQLNLNIEKLYERAKVSSAQVKELELPQQLIYRRTYRSDNVADKTVLLRSTALEAMRAHGTDITRRMYFIQFPRFWCKEQYRKVLKFKRLRSYNLSGTYNGRGNLKHESGWNHAF